MAKWQFIYNTLEGKKVGKTIKANNKQEAIKKGFEYVKKQYLTPSYSWECYLISC